MIKYTFLGNRKMNSEIRISYKKFVIFIITIIIVFIYVLSKNSCESSQPEKVVFEEPIIYAVTPTYYRPVQKAELTR